MRHRLGSRTDSGDGSFIQDMSGSRVVDMTEVGSDSEFVENDSLDAT